MDAEPSRGASIRREARHFGYRRPCPLGPPTQGCEPNPLKTPYEAGKGPGAGRHGVVVQPSVDHLPQPLRCLVDVFVHPRAESLLEPFQGSCDPLRNRFAPQTKAAVPRLPAVVRETEEIEGLGSTFPTRPAGRHREPAELDEARLVGMQVERELVHPLPEVAEKLFRVRLALATHNEVSRPGESHPRALAELYVNVSAHTAPIIQPALNGFAWLDGSSRARG